MTTICEEVRGNRVLISDGAWGTFLMAEGLQLNECPELWNLEHPEVVRNIAQSYVDAGADLINTNSFGGSRCKLEKYGLADSVGEINEAAARLSREAAGPDRHVMGSIGPTGKLLIMGDITEEALYDVFKEQAMALERGGADAILVETMSALDEAALAVRAAKENTALEIICTFTYEREVNGIWRTMMGVSPEQMAETLLDAGADIIGANCSVGPKEMVGVVKALRAAAPGTPILLHPNAGLPQPCEGGVTYPETPDSMAGYVPALLDAGANIIGGCCGTTPAHIRAIADAVQKATA
jgi:5-methyltetrahydrofolate--homocysteine methyltransferase